MSAFLLLMALLRFKYANFLNLFKPKKRNSNLKNAMNEFKINDLISLKFLLALCPSF